MSIEYMPTRSPWALNDSQLDRLRRELDAAERAAAAATDWTTRTRREQEAKHLRGLLRSAEFERSRELRLPHAPTQQARAEHLARAVERGEFIEPVAYFEQRKPNAAPAANAANASTGTARLCVCSRSGWMGGGTGR